MLEEILIAVRRLEDGNPSLLPSSIAWERYGHEILGHRLGTGLSLHVKEEHVDRVHWYDSIFREDLLDYGTGDFFSIRRLKGRNVSDRLSAGLTYVESTEQKVLFSETDLTAYDSSTRQLLPVSSLLPEREAAFTHPFTISFGSPIAPGESFDVTYAIRLPRELEVLSSVKETMSISLARVARGVGELTFNVVLDFKPASVSIMCLDSSGAPVACGGSAPRVEQYLPTTWEEEHFDLEWTSPAQYVIRWHCLAPTSVLYIIEYIR